MLQYRWRRGGQISICRCTITLSLDVPDDELYILVWTGSLLSVAFMQDLTIKAAQGMDPTKQRDVDEKMKELDGTDNKAKLGANAILAVSLAVAKVQNLPTV